MSKGWVLESMGWNWEDKLEFSTTNLVEDQSEYVLPLTILRLKRVEVKYPGSTVYVKATLFDDLNTDQALGNSELVGASEAHPQFRVGDRSIFLYPAPSATVSAGLRIETVEDVTDLSTGTDIPDLPVVLHRLLSAGAAHDYALAKEMTTKKTNLYREIYGTPGIIGSGLKYQLESIYSRRENSVKPVIKVRRENYN